MLSKYKYPSNVVSSSESDSDAESTDSDSNSDSETSIIATKAMMAIAEPGSDTDVKNSKAELLSKISDSSLDNSDRRIFFIDKDSQNDKSLQPHSHRVSSTNIVTNDAHYSDVVDDTKQNTVPTKNQRNDNFLFINNLSQNNAEDKNIYAIYSEKRKRKKGIAGIGLYERKSHLPVKKKKTELSSSIQDHVNRDGLYINSHVYQQFTKGDAGKLNPIVPSVQSEKIVDKLLKKSVLPSDLERQHTIPPYQVSLHAERLRRREERSKTKGKDWFNMSAPEMTEEKKNDLALIRMRHVLDPKRFYKRPDLKVMPKFFQTGKIIADATDFYSSRVPKKQQKKTLVDELLEDAEFKKFSKRKYAEIMEKKQAMNRSYRGAAKHMKRLKKNKR